MASRNRISRQEGFGRTLRSGSRAGSRAFVVSVRLGCQAGEASTNPSRAGVSVAKKQVRLATRRNRLKRQVRAALAEILPGLPPDSRVVVRVLSGAETLSFDKTRSELVRLVRVASTKENRGNCG